MREKRIITASVSGVLHPGVGILEDYLAIFLDNYVDKYVRSVFVSYAPNTGGSVTTTSLRIGRLMIATGILTPAVAGLQLDPFSPDINVPGTHRVLVNQLVRNTREFIFPGKGLFIPAAATATIIIGASVGEADSASSPSASVAYLSMVGQEGEAYGGQKEPRLKY